MIGRDPGLAVMTTVGIIGSGMIGGTVARLSVAAGYHVVVSNSRGPETLAELAAELGPLATAGTAGQAAEAGDMVLVSVPDKAFGDLPVKPLAGKPVMDTGNYYPQRAGHLKELDTGALTSSGLLQRGLPGAQVVKVFNNIFFKHLGSLARPHGAQDRSALPIAGDSAAAKAAVTAFLDSIGYDAADAGSLADSWHQEPGTPVYGTPYGPFTDEAGTVAPAARITPPGRRPPVDRAVDRLSPKLRLIRQAIPGLTWDFTAVAGRRSGYFKVSGIGAPMSSKACRWVLVGSVSIAMVTSVPVYRTWLRVSVARCSIRPRKLR